MIDKGYRELCEYMNNVEHLMFMDREIISGPPLGSEGLGSFWTAKNDMRLTCGTPKEPAMKTETEIMGMETQRSSTPTSVKVFLKEAIRRILQEGELSLHEHYKSSKKNIKNLTTGKLLVYHLLTTFRNIVMGLAIQSREHQTILKGCCSLTVSLLVLMVLRQSWKVKR